MVDDLLLALMLVRHTCQSPHELYFRYAGPHDGFLPEGVPSSCPSVSGLPHLLDGMSMVLRAQLCCSFKTRCHPAPFILSSCTDTIPNVALLATFKCQMDGPVKIYIPDIELPSGRV